MQKLHDVSKHGAGRQGFRCNDILVSLCACLWVATANICAWKACKANVALRHHVDLTADRALCPWKCEGRCLCKDHWHFFPGKHSFEKVLFFKRRVEKAALNEHDQASLLLVAQSSKEALAQPLNTSGPNRQGNLLDVMLPILRMWLFERSTDKRR